MTAGVFSLLLVVIALVAGVEAFHLHNGVSNLKLVQPGNKMSVARLQMKKDDLGELKLDLESLDPQERARVESVRRVNENLAEIEKIEGMIGEDQQKKWARMMEDYDQELEDIEVLKTKFSGQAGLDVQQVGASGWSDLADRPFLAFMDGAALTLFAYIGRATHGNPEFDLATVGTALPFLVGWFALAPLAGAYTRQAILSQGDSLKKVVPAWLAAAPAGIALRALYKGEVPPTPFIVVTMLTTLVIMASWRALYIQINGDPDAEFRKGGIFDGFRMLTTLIQRW